MRLSEIVHSSKNTPESNLVTALELIRNRYRDKNLPPKISTKSLINLVLNTDKTFDFQALQDASNTNPAVKNLIKNIDADYVELYSLDDEPEEESLPSPEDLPPPMDTDLPDMSEPGMDQMSADQGAAVLAEPVDVVDDMAKRAARNRGAPISK
jgi:hypothetical protein